VNELNQLIAHVHVPKTAGTAINAFLFKSLGAGQDHVQAMIDDPVALRQSVRQMGWVAGHVPAPKFRDRLTKIGVSARWITALREPIEQVVSHYNWLIEIGHRGETFFKGHPPAIQQIHHRIATSDNNDPRVVMQNIEAHAGLFLNCQARYVVGPEFARPEVSYAAALDAFDVVIFSNDVAAGLSGLLPMSEGASEHSNVSPYRFDRDVFKDPRLRRFLLDRNRADEALWAVARERVHAVRRSVEA